MNRRSLFGLALATLAPSAVAQASGGGPRPKRAITVSPWHSPFNAAFAADLRRRLAQVRWSDNVVGDWSYGTAQQALRQLVHHWHAGYDWTKAAKRINALPHFHADVDGFALHFLRFKSRSASPQPLLLLNGWPSSFVEYGKLAPMLADMGFDVIIPALPGFGYSARPGAPNQVQAVELFHRLMTEGLAYPSYMISGTDIGAGVASRMALAYPGAVHGLHISSVMDPALDEASPPLTADELAYQRTVKKWHAEEGAYMHLQATRPQTLAYALNDSPAGLASWILEKFRYWSDAGEDLFEVFPLDMLVDNLNIYWSTQTIGSSMRAYYEAKHFRAPPAIGERVLVPTAICMWPRDLVLAPKSWAERFYNVRQYTVQQRGGHFPAWELPDLYAADLREFLLALH